MEKSANDPGKEKVKATPEGLDVDFCVMLDCTGSMGSYINMSRNKIKDIIKQVKEQYSDSAIRIAIVGYRDIKDKKRFELFHFSEDVDKAKTFLDGLHADGGADTPEDVNGGFQKALYELQWQNPVRILIHVADAPCHGKAFHNCNDDSFPMGHPSDKPWEQLFKDLVETGIDYTFLKITEQTNKMFTEFKKIADKCGAEEYDIAFTEEPINGENLSQKSGKKSAEEGFAAVISDKIKVSVERGLKRGLARRLEKRTANNAKLMSKIREIIKKRVSEINIDKMREKYKDLAAKVGECILSSNNFIDALADEDCLCLTFNIGRSQSAIVDPTHIIIKDVYPSFITAGSFFYSTEYALKKDKLAHGGYEKHAEGMIVKGAASENITGVLPLYFCEENWPVAKQLLKLTLAWDVTLDAAGYEYTQMKVVPFLILAKLAQMMHEKPGSEFLAFQFELVKQTCMKIMEDGSKPESETNFIEGVMNQYNNYVEDPLSRTVDAISSNLVFLAQLYIAFELGQKSKGEEYFDKMFLGILEEELRRKQIPLPEELNKHEWQLKLLNVNFEEHVIKPYNTFVEEYNAQLAGEEHKGEEEKKISVGDPRSKEIKDYTINWKSESGEYNKEQMHAFDDYKTCLKIVMAYLYPMRQLLTTKKAEDPTRFKEWGFNNENRFFTLYIQNKTQHKNAARRAAIHANEYWNPLTQSQGYIRNLYNSLVEAEKSKRINAFLLSVRGPTGEFIASDETFMTATSVMAMTSRSVEDKLSSGYAVSKGLDKIGKPQLTITVLGHVDSGKSTSCGHLLYKMGKIDKRTLEKLENEAKEMGRMSFKYAWIVDRLKAERERGISIEVSTMNFESPKYSYSFLNTPGHKDFMKNLITGASQADCAILVVAAAANEFETGISSTGQTRDHALIAFTFGIKQLIVCVNKMDDASVNWSQSRFEEIKGKMSTSLKKIGYKPEEAQFIPISGYLGDNLTEKSTNLSWYTGQTLIEALDSLQLPKKPVEKPLRIPLISSFKIGVVGTVPIGVVQSGVIKRNMLVSFAPSNVSGNIKGIETYHEQMDQAGPGESIGFWVSAINHSALRRGYVCGDPANDPPKVAVTFKAQIIILSHPGEIKKGYTPVVDIHTAHVACKFEEIHSKLDKRSGKVIEESPKFVRSGDVCIVTLRPMQPLCVEAFSDYPSLGRFTIRDLRKIVGVGVIRSVEKSETKPLK